MTGSSPEANAFVVPGGKVVVYTGLLKLIDSDDELAAVLAHEAAHVVARHAVCTPTRCALVPCTPPGKHQSCEGCASGWGRT
jgi:Zn-dependent protease with chaperone function